MRQFNVGKCPKNYTSTGGDNILRMKIWRHN